VVGCCEKSFRIVVICCGWIDVQRDNIDDPLSRHLGVRANALGAAHKLLGDSPVDTGQMNPDVGSQHVHPVYRVSDRTTIDTGEKGHSRDLCPVTSLKQLLDGCGHAKVGNIPAL
jgi:hypothetical protein